jgi:NADPH2:quinone reductase
MRAVLCKAFGPPESLVVEDLPDPRPAEGEVVVDVAVAGMNFFDSLIIQNKYQFKPALPFSPGAELAGRVSAVGAGIDRSWLGRRVAAWIGWGACRTKVVVPAQALVPVPDGLPDEAAAGLMVTYGTTLHALQDRARLQPGETLVVLGASGGVGLAAVEIGALMGARVIACASSPEKLAIAGEHGATDLIDYSAGDFREALKAIVGAKGVDVVYDPVGGALAEPALRSMAWKGRYLVIGFAAGEIPKFPLNLVLLKGCDVQGVFWGAFTDKEPAAHAANTAVLMQWAAEGRIRALASAIYPLEETGAAIRLIAERRAAGKVLVKT